MKLKFKTAKSTVAATQRVAGLSDAPRPAIRRMAASAFTLTELLVVITIIAILASLITAGAMNAMRRSQEAAITMEIGQLADAVERFKTETGGAYPPNGVNNGTVTVAVNDFVRSFRKAFPRHNEPERLIRALAGENGSNPNPLPGGMNAAEAVYFWLGGFSTDPVYPISGPGGPAFDPTSTTGEILENRNGLFEFDLTRLAPRTEDGAFDDSAAGGGRFIVYPNPTGTGGANLRINLWRYAPKGSESAYIYCDASRYDPANYDLDLSGDLGLGIYGVKKAREGVASPGGIADVVFMNKGKYQILHPGLDGEWGAMSGFQTNGTTVPMLLYPAGPFTGELADTLTNFTTGTLENAQE
jgi:prepilin-type N-terminal cleavage/methylation domain-containing protein